MNLAESRAPGVRLPRLWPASRAGISQRGRQGTHLPARSAHLLRRRLAKLCARFTSGVFRGTNAPLPLRPPGAGRPGVRGVALPLPEEPVPASLDTRDVMEVTNGKLRRFLMLKSCSSVHLDCARVPLAAHTFALMRVALATRKVASRAGALGAARETHLRCRATGSAGFVRVGPRYSFHMARILRWGFAARSRKIQDKSSQFGRHVAADLGRATRRKLWCSAEVVHGRRCGPTRSPCTARRLLSTIGTELRIAVEHTTSLVFC
jgi:hypothetical protein